MKWLAPGRGLLAIGQDFPFLQPEFVIDKGHYHSRTDGYGGSLVGRIQDLENPVRFAAEDYG